MSVKYKVLTYQGFAWLKDCGTFDDFNEAQDELQEQHDIYCHGSESEEDFNHNSEAFYFDSRIEEVVDNE